MSRWIAYRVVGTPIGGAGLHKLGGLNAPHQPAAMKRAREKWPAVVPETITVRRPEAILLKQIRGAKKLNKQIRAAARIEP
jgi:hypothetical protein